MKVTVDNYTECCLRTWGGENQKERAKLGVIGEAGEVAEVLKKFLRGDFDEVERDRRLIKELGDLLYYIAIDMYLNNESFVYVVNNSIDDYGDIYGIIDAITGCNEYYVVDAFCGFLKKHKFTIEQVMQANIDKLQSRSERNVIQGSGSDR